MKCVENLVLKTSTLAHIQFELATFRRAKSRIDKETKRTRRETFEGAGRRLECFALKCFGNARRQIRQLFVRFKKLKLLLQGDEHGQFKQCRSASRFRRIDEYRRQFARMLRLLP